MIKTGVFRSLAVESFTSNCKTFSSLSWSIIGTLNAKLKTKSNEDQSKRGYNQKQSKSRRDQ